jgi:hypothetical protein
MVEIPHHEKIPGRARSPNCAEAIPPRLGWSGHQSGLSDTASYFVQQRHGLHDLSRRQQIDQQDVLKFAAA